MDRLTINVNHEWRRSWVEPESSSGSEGTALWSSVRHQEDKAPYSGCRLWSVSHTLLWSSLISVMGDPALVLSVSFSTNYYELPRAGQLQCLAQVFEKKNYSLLCNELFLFLFTIPEKNKKQKTKEVTTICRICNVQRPGSQGATRM